MQFCNYFKRDEKEREFPQIFAIFIASMTFLSHGLSLAWPAPAMLQLVHNNSTNVSFEETTYFILISATSMAITAPFFPQLIDIIGRKRSILLTTVPQLAAWVCTALSTEAWHFYIARVLSGIGDAGAYSTVPVYVAEISRPIVRSTWGNVAAVAVTAGIFLINLIAACTNVITAAWICLSVPLIQIAVFSCMPESPYYLVMKNKENEAKKSLEFLRWTTNVDGELITLQSDVQRQISESGSIKDMFTIRSNRKALLICMLVRVAQIFNGLPVFVASTHYFFQISGTRVTESISAILFGGILCLSYAIGPWFINRWGRKRLIILSCCSCAIITTILTVYFYLRQYYPSLVDFLNWLPIACVLIFVVLGSLGLGTLPTLIVGELFSTSIKAKAVGVMNIIVALGYVILPKLFQYLQFNIGMFAPFILFSVNSYVCAFLSYLYVIETKEKTLEEIQIMLKK